MACNGHVMCTVCGELFSHSGIADLERQLAEYEKLEKEAEWLKGPGESIRAKCEQYWNEYVSLCPEEMHAILGFIHRNCRELEDKLAAAQADVERYRRMLDTSLRGLDAARNQEEKE